MTIWSHIPGGIEEIVSDGINVSCNDAGGYALYAIGYSGDSYHDVSNVSFFTMRPILTCGCVKCVILAKTE